MALPLLGFMVCALAGMGQGLVATPLSHSFSSRYEPVAWRQPGRSTPGSIGAPSPRHVIPADMTEFSPGLIGLQAVACFSASVVGFGDALIVIPLLAICYNVGPEFGAPLVSCVSVAMFSSNLLIDFVTGKSQSVGRWTESAVLALGAALGVPVGVQTLLTVNTLVIRGAIGVFLMAFGAYKLVQSKQTSEASYGLVQIVLPCGFAAGILGGLLSAPGPPVIALSRYAKWDASTSRVMFSRFFLPVQVFATFDFWQSGLLTDAVLTQAVTALPAVACAVGLGTFCNRQIQADDFDTLVATLLIILGSLSIVFLPK